MKIKKRIVKKGENWVETYNINNLLANENASYVQLHDRVYTNKLTELGQYLNLSDEGIDPAYVLGDYYLTTTNVKNDTLNIPDAGIYKISLSIDTCFMLGRTPPPSGSLYTITYNLIDNNNAVISQLMDQKVIPIDTNMFLASVLSRSFLFEVADNFSMSVILYDFNFDLALMNQMEAYNIVFIVERMPEPFKS